MPKPYISRPSGTPAERCMVYPMVPISGEDAYIMYASASGENKWDDLLVKIEAETDALREAKYLNITLSLSNKEWKHERGGIDFLEKLYNFTSSLYPEFVNNSQNVVLDDSLGDTVIAMIVSMPLDFNRWCHENT